MYVIVTVTKLVGGTIKVTVNRPHRRIPSTQECVRFCCTWVFHKRRWKFAVMWANHHWKNVYPAHSPDIVALRWGGQVTSLDCHRKASLAALPQTAIFLL